MPELTGDEVRALRRRAMLLHDTEARRPADVVTWFGALQAQDLWSGHWSFGVRTTLTEADVVRAAEAREIVRTWPMRGTIHFVPPADARWMLELCASRQRSAGLRRAQNLGLDERSCDRAAELLGAALTGGRRLTRSRCVAVLRDAGLVTEPTHAYHLLWHASHLGVTCIGPNEGKEQTFVLLDDWAPDQVRFDRDAALEELARRYFRSHGPATRQDFAGWTGLTLTDADRAIAANGDALTFVDVDGQRLVAWVAALDDRPSKGRELVLLPGFDEYVLGYKDRSLLLDNEHRERVVPGNNGMFMPTVVQDGRVVGTWKRTVTRSQLRVTVSLFKGRVDDLGAPARRSLDQAVAAFGRYTGRTATLEG